MVQIHNINLSVLRAHTIISEEQTDLFRLEFSYTIFDFFTTILSFTFFVHQSGREGGGLQGYNTPDNLEQSPELYKLHIFD